MSIEYKINAQIPTSQFITLLINSTLGQRRPIQDQDCMEGMVKNSNLIITAWDGENIVGIARSVTDFNFACYLSDLAVDIKYHNKGIGKMLIKLTQEQLGPHCTLILIAAPAANSYYEHLGFTNNQKCWILERKKSIVS
jgi:predicted N-acetyltransferase YhbS